jgi:thioredoxin reductase
MARLPGWQNTLADAASRVTLGRMNSNWDCVVVGAGAAGLSAALVLGRARRRTLVIDAGGQSNLAAHGIGGLLGQDTRPPADFYAAARAELTAYPSVEVRAGEVVGGEAVEGTFTLEPADGSAETARRVLLAIGMEYRYRRVPGAEQRWGRSVFHCPFCHGWEVRDRALAVLDRGDSGAHRALLLRQWSDDVTLLADGPADLGADEAQRLEAAGVAVDERPVAELRGPGDELTAIAFADGTERPCGGLLVPVTLHQRSALAERLGATLAEPNPLVAGGVAVDAKYATTVPGLFAAGDTAVPMPSVAAAIASGHTAAASVVQSLAFEAPAAAAAR